MEQGGEVNCREGDTTKIAQSTDCSSIYWFSFTVSLLQGNSLPKLITFIVARLTKLCFHQR